MAAQPNLEETTAHAAHGTPLAPITLEDAGYQRLINLSPMPIAIHVMGTLVFANQAVARLMHVDSPEELYGRSVMEFVHPDSQELVKKRVALIYKEGMHATDVVQEKLICADGAVIEVEIVSLLFNYQGKTAIQLTLRDVTEQHRARRELENANNLLSTITHNASLGLMMMDAEQKCTFMNPAAEQITGYRLRDVKDGPLHNFIHNSKPDGTPYPIDACPIDRALPDNSRQSGEEVFVRKDGSMYPVRFTASPIIEDGQPVGTVIEIQDLTEEKRAQAVLVESEKRFRELADSMPQMVWIADADGTIVYRNRKWFEFTGFDDDLDDAAWQALIHPADRQAVYTVWHESLSSGQQFQLEYRMQDRKHPGIFRWFLGRSVPVRDANGTITKWYGTGTDVTDIRRTNQRKKELEGIAAALTEQRTQLVALNQAKDEFISLASHQLRTPATGVKQFVGMVLEGYGGDISPEVRRFLEKAYESNDRQIAIVNDLLQVAQVDAGKVQLRKTDVDVNALVSAVLQEQQSRFTERKQRVTFRPRKEPLIVSADPDRLRMVLDNLIDNASKYTPTGRSIRISTTTLARSVKITVTDEGVGIDPADFDKIFLKFSRIDNPLSAHVGGSGLGLYWVKKIVGLHEGTIAVSSKPGAGTTFTVKLPR